MCASAFLRAAPVLVPDVDAFPGHIACDGETKSEVVLPVVVEGRCVGVLDLDCVALEGFTEEDVRGLEGVVEIVAKACDW